MKKINAYIEYKIGDEITYNDIKFYVIKNSSSEEDIVTTLKAEPLTVEEINKYGKVGTNENVVNIYSWPKSSNSFQTAYNSNGYGGMQYYSSDTCNSAPVPIDQGCTSNYYYSNIKNVVDAWVEDKIKNVVSETRLITYDELLNNLGFELDEEQTSYKASIEYSPSWVFDNNYRYWTMSQKEDSDSIIYIDNSGKISMTSTYVDSITVRPVVLLKKTALSNKDEFLFDNNTKNINVSDINENLNDNVNVPNTYLSNSIIIIISGLIISCVSLVIYYIIKKERK